MATALTIPRCGHLCRFDAKVTPADQQCLEPTCSLHNLAVCATCSDNFHASGEMREHRQSVISSTQSRVATVYCHLRLLVLILGSVLAACPQCQLERSYYLCLDCDLTFCAPCFRVIHEPSKVQAHKMISMEGTKCRYCGLLAYTPCVTSLVAVQERRRRFCLRQSCRGPPRQGSHRSSPLTQRKLPRRSPRRRKLTVKRTAVL